MVWVKLDDQFTENPKVVQAGPLAGWLHVCGLVYCGRNLTDGFIPAVMVPRLATFDHIGITTGGMAGMFEFGHDIEHAELVDQLIAVGLWEETDGGYVIHDYLDYNPSKADVLAERQANAKRQKEFQERRRKANGQFGSQDIDTNGVTNTVSNAVTNTTPYPYPNKDTDKGADAPPVSPASFESWLAALKSPQSIGETNGIAVLVRMGAALYPHWPPDAYGRVGKLAKTAGSQSKLAQALWENASKPLATPLDYLTSAVAGKARADPPPKPRKVFRVEDAT